MNDDSTGQDRDRPSPPPLSRFRDFAIWFTLALLEPSLVVIAWHDEVVDRIGPDP